MPARKSDTAITVTLRGPFAALVRERVRGGLYRSPDDVVRDALRSLREREASDILAVRAAIAQGHADADAGRILDGEAFFKELGREKPRTARRRRA